MKDNPKMWIIDVINNHGNNYSRICFNRVFNDLFNSKEACIKMKGNTVIISKPSIDSNKVYKFYGNGFYLATTLDLEHGDYSLIESTEDYFLFEKV